MFTGIIEELGKIKKIERQGTKQALHIEANLIFDDLKLGDSVAVNGVCLTASKIEKKFFVADVMNETYARTNFSKLRMGSVVNLERAMPANGRFGGHIVSGHIDGVGNIEKIEKDSNSIWFYIKAGENIMKYIVEKGSIAINGTSLTVAKKERTRFAVSCIPHTIKNTNLSTMKNGDEVNLENDIVGKYIENFADKHKKMSFELFERAGF